MNIPIVFGSTSDRGKVEPGITRFVDDYPGVQVTAHWASADNTPEKVRRLLGQLLEHKVLVSGAGMSNVLTGSLKAKVDHTVPNIGVPISDSVYAGLSSVLATVEKPPRNPVLAVGVDNSYAGLNIARRYIQGREAVDGVQSLTKVHLVDHDGKMYQGVAAKLEHYGLPFEVVGVDGIDADAVIITPFLTHQRNTLQTIDDRLETGGGVQIGIVCNENFLFVREGRTEYVNLGHYMDTFRMRLDATGFVTAGKHGYTNAAIAAAQLMRHPGALEIIKGEKTDKRDTLTAVEPTVYRGE